MITKLGIDGVVLGAASLEYAGFASIIKYVSSKITKIEHPETVMAR
jgi:triosephosphate isomerase